MTDEEQKLAKLKQALADAGEENPDGENPKAEKPIRVRALRNVTVDDKRFQKDQEGSLTPQQYAATACNFERIATLALLCLLWLFAAPNQAQAQQYTVTTLTVATTFNATTTNTVTSATNTITKHDKVAVQVSFKLAGAGTSTCVISIYGSVDGVTYSNNALGTLSIAANGTSTVSGVLLLDAGACGYISLGTVTNPNASGITNFAASVATKPRRTG